MRNVITLNKKNRQEAETATSNKSASHETSSKAAGQPVIQVRQNKLNRQAQPYAKDEHATVSLSSWWNNSSAVELAEEDRNDPDLATGFAGFGRYSLQPG